ncbi:MAG: hypothetical protein RBS80_12640 [Thermoguttaceae bacterium]|jgi:hypothetical protein|nr:hypothetical protein [Thermoguttaceae bacterium]
MTLLSRTGSSGFSFLAVLAGVIALTGAPLSGAPLYSTSFHGTVGELPEDWGVLLGDVGNPGWRISADGEYRFDASGTGLSHYTGSFANGQPGNAFADGTIETTFRRGGTNVVGVVARMQDSDNYYHARLYQDDLQIYRFRAGAATLLGSVEASGYTAGQSWTLSMTLLGTTISASVFDQFGSQVASLSRSDAEFASGTVGVRGTAVSVWEDFLVNAPVDLNVDIGLQGAGSVQAGFQSLAETNNSGSYSTSPKAKWLDSQLGNANRVNVELASGGGGRMGFRQRSDVTHAMGDLAEDFVFNLDGDRLNLTLGSLLPGYYEMTTYHHDSDNYITGTLDVSVSDARSSGRSVVQGVTVTNGTTPAAIGSTTFSFHSDGVHPTVIHVDANTVMHALLNGFQLAPAAESLRVDFGLNGQDVQNGFSAFSRAISTTGQQSETFTSGLGADGSVTVRVAGDNNSLSWRDRGSSTAPNLPDVAEDFVFNLTWLELTLEGLAPNTYLLTTYHHDLSHVGSPLDIEVWDVAGDGRTVVSELWQTASQPAADPALATFLIHAGDDPVRIRFTNLYEGTAPPIARLNAFSITLIPEPNALLLGCMGLLSLLLVRRRLSEER